MMDTITKEKTELRDKYAKEISQKKIKLEEQLAELEQKRKDFLIKNGTAIICKCGKFEENPEHNICYSCWREIQRKKRIADVEHKLNGAKIINLVFRCNEEIAEMTVNKDGISFNLEVHGGFDDIPYLRIENEWCENPPLRTSRPGDMPRVEKSLLSFVKSRKKI